MLFVASAFNLLTLFFEESDFKVLFCKLEKMKNNRKHNDKQRYIASNPLPIQL